MGGQKRLIRHFPHFFQTGDTENLFYKFMEVFGSMFDLAEEDLMKVMRSHWVDTANNEGTHSSSVYSRGDLDKIFVLMIRALEGTSLLKQINRREGLDGLEDDAIYRQRIKGVIRVLREGASTREGIRSIVAANLGIFGDSEEAIAARKKIEIIEYLPRVVTTPFYPLQLFQTIVINNPNPEDTPVTIQLRAGKAPSPSFILEDLKIKNVTTGDGVQRLGVFEWGRSLVVLPDGSATYDGNATSLVIDDALPTLPHGVSLWQVEGVVGQFYESEFDPLNHQFDHAVFAPFIPVVSLRLTYTQFQPATFLVRIPWKIAGYSKLWDELEDKPRFQIKKIVSVVKGAGIDGVVAFRKDFQETHQINEAFFTEEDDHTYVDQQDQEDNLLFGGVFDYTRYDQSAFQ